jgi:TIR domain
VTAAAAVAEALKHSLEQALDVSAFASSTDINLGARWRIEIDNALDAANALLVLCSQWSVARRWINLRRAPADNSEIGGTKFLNPPSIFLGPI